MEGYCNNPAHIALSDVDWIILALDRARGGGGGGRWEKGGGPPF